MEGGFYREFVPARHNLDHSVVLDRAHPAMTLSTPQRTYRGRYGHFEFKTPTRDEVKYHRSHLQCAFWVAKTPEIVSSRGSSLRPPGEMVPKTCSSGFLRPGTQSVPACGITFHRDTGGGVVATQTLIGTVGNGHSFNATRRGTAR